MRVLKAERETNAAELKVAQAYTTDARQRKEEKKE